MTANQTLQFLEATLDIEKLIIEVQNRPALWDMTQGDYSDRIKRKQCWEEITDVFSLGSDLTLEDKKKLGDILHKKWKNIRDRFARDIQERKGKSGDGARKKLPYMYSHQLEFLRDTVTPKRTVSSFAESTSVQEEREEEEEEEHDGDEEEDEPQGATSASSTRSSTTNVLRTRVPQVGKKRLHPVEDKILRTLDRYENRAKIVKENVEDNDNRHFLLSLVQSLTSLPRHLNTSCRIEIMQCINKYETMSHQHQHQQLLPYLPTTHSYPHHGQYNLQQQHQSQQKPNQHHVQPMHPTQMYVQNQLTSHQYPPRASVTPRPTPSPAESAASYISNFNDETDLISNI